MSRVIKFGALLPYLFNKSSSGLFPLNLSPVYGCPDWKKAVNPPLIPKGSFVEYNDKVKSCVLSYGINNSCCGASTSIAPNAAASYSLLALAVEYVYCNVELNNLPLFSTVKSKPIAVPKSLSRSSLVYSIGNFFSKLLLISLIV